MNRTALFTLGVALSLLAGCSGLQMQAPSIVACDYPDAPQTSAPAWVCDAPIDGVAVSAVGSAANGGVGYDALKDTAAAAARVRLARRMQDYVANLVKRYAKANGAVSVETIDKIAASLGKQITADALTGSRVFRTAISPNRTLYVLLGVETDLATQHAEDILRASMQSDPALWQEFDAEMGQAVRATDIVNAR